MVREDHRYDQDRDDRRSFLRKTAAAGGALALGTMAGCQGNGGDGESDTSSAGGEDEAPSGEKVEQITYFNNPQSYDPQRHDAINFVADRLAEAGFDIDVEVQEWGSLYETVVDQTDYGITTWVGYIGSDPGALLLDHYTSDGPQNFTNWAPEDVEQMAQEQMAQTDIEQRIETIHEIQSRVVEEAPMTSVMHTDTPSVYNSNHIQNPDPSMSGFHGFWNMANLEASVDDLVSNWAESMGSFNIFSWGTETKLKYQFDLIYDKLLRIDSDYQIDTEHGLASSYERPDSESIKFEIMEGHSFHDGETVTIEDVEFTFNYLQEKEAPAFSTPLSYLDNVEILDDTTIQLNLNQSLGPADYFIGAGVHILPKHVWEGIENPSQQETNNELVTGSGPMELDYWDRGTEFRLAAFDDHFIDLDFEGRIWRIIPESATVQELLSNGEMSYLGFGFNEQIAELLNTTDFLEGIRSVSPYTLHFSMNTERISDIELRKAAADVVPKTAIVEQFYDGYGEKGLSPISPRYGDYHNSDLPQTAESVEAARGRLEEAGYQWDSDGMLHYPPET